MVSTYTDERLSIVPVSLKAANEIVSQWHRHHGAKNNGYRFAVGVALAGRIVGVAIVGNPVAIGLADGWTLEVNRTCTDGTRNANSMLYGAAWRTAKGLGFHRLITYTLPAEGGASLRAAGWTCAGEAGGDSWNRPNCGRPRIDKIPLEPKLRWEVTTSDYMRMKDFRPPGVESDSGNDSQLLFTEMTA